MIRYNIKRYTKCIIIIHVKILCVNSVIDNLRLD